MQYSRTNAGPGSWHKLLRNSLLSASICLPTAGFAIDLRMMPVGDSITEGFTPANGSGTASYRQQFENKLNAANCAFEMVGGKLENNPPTAYQSFHEGYSGGWARQFINGTSGASGAPAIADITVTHSPHVILMHLGSNDIRQGQTTDQTLASIRDLIVKVNSVNPEIVILLANVIPWYGENNGNNPPPFEGNNGIEGEVALLGSKIAAAIQNGFPNENGAPLVFPNVHLVDVVEGYTQAMMQSDLIHPNALGEEFIAQQFFDTVDALGLCDIDLPDVVAPETILASPSTTVPYIGPDSVFKGRATDIGGSGLQRIRIAIGDNNSANASGTPTSWYNFSSNTFGSYSETQINVPQNPLRDVFSWNISIPPLDESGSYQFYALAVDNNGNQNYVDGQGVWPANTQFSIDSTIPFAESSRPIDGGFVSPSVSYTIEGSMSDDKSGVNRVLARLQQTGVSPLQYWNGLEWQDSSTWVEADLNTNADTWSLPDVDLGNIGNYRLLLRAFDAVGNQSNSAQNPRTEFTVEIPDTTAPGAVTEFPSNASQVQPGTINISGTSSDDNSGVARVLVRIQQANAPSARYWNGTSWQVNSKWLDATLGLNNDWTIAGVDATRKTIYRVNLRAFDNAGNQSFSGNNPKTVFHVVDPDVVNPSAAPTVPANGATVPLGLIDVKGISSDADSGVKKVLVRIQRRSSPVRYWNGSGWTTKSTWRTATLNTNGDWTIPDVNLTRSYDYRVIVRAFDNAGNQATAGQNPAVTFTAQ
jgi:lysophospholipase L1-like esterase